MGRISGDGFIRVADGSARWGRFGAAGLLVRHHDPADEHPHLFLARRSERCHRGGTWAIPGGALDHGEHPLDGAVREFEEEIGLRLEHFDVADTYEDDHGGWSYWTFVVDVQQRFPEPAIVSWETEAVRWVPVPEVPRLELFDAFAVTLERLGLLPSLRS